MPQITSDWIGAQKNMILGEIKRMEGALEMLKLVEEQITTPEAKEALTLDDLKNVMGADSVEVIENEKGGNNGV